MDRNYIANQGSGALDEVRWLISKLKLGQNVSIQGTPGNGKSSLVRFVADIMGKNLYSRACDVNDLISDYSGEVTMHNSGTQLSITPLRLALENGGIFLNEETSEMSGSIQKGLSVLLSDDRLDFNLPTIREQNFKTLNDYKKDGWKINEFCYVETFNPSNNSVGKDNFEESHANRLASYHFQDIDSLLSIGIELQKQDISIPSLEKCIEQRGVSEKLEFLNFVEGTWKNFKKEEVKLAKAYSYCNSDKLKENFNNIVEEINEVNSFYISLAKFFVEVKSCININSANTDSLFDSSIKSDVKNLRLNSPTQRNYDSAIKTYEMFKNEGFNEDLIKSEIASEQIRAICYGAKAKKVLNGTNQLEFLESIARKYSILVNDSPNVTF